MEQRTLVPLNKGVKGKKGDPSSYIPGPVKGDDKKRIMYAVKAHVNRYRGTLPTIVFGNLQTASVVMTFLLPKDYFCWMGVWKYSITVLTNPVNRPLWQIHVVTVAHAPALMLTLLPLLINELRIVGRQQAPSYIKAQAIKKQMEIAQAKRDAKRWGMRDPDEPLVDDDDVHIDGWGEIY